jgi:hypothetical protein
MASTQSSSSSTRPSPGGSFWNTGEPTTVAANALHVANLHDVVEGIEILLAPAALCVIEDPYWGDVVAQTAFDQIYDEHASYFTLSSLSHLVEQHGLAVLDAARPMRTADRCDMIAQVIAAGSPRATALLDHERRSGLHHPQAFDRFASGPSMPLEVDGPAAAVQSRRATGRGLRRDVQEHDDHQLFGITPDLIEFISDTTPAKQGTFSPRAYTGASSPRFRVVLSRSGAAVLVEPRRRSHRQGAGVLAQRRPLDRLRARRPRVVMGRVGQERATGVNSRAASRARLVRNLGAVHEVM